MRYARCRCVEQQAHFWLLWYYNSGNCPLLIHHTPQANLSLCPNRCCFQSNPSLRGSWLADEMAISYNDLFLTPFTWLKAKNCSLKIANSKVIVCHCSAIHHSFGCYNISLCLIWNEIINSPRKDLSLKIGLEQKLAFWLAEL